MAETKSRAARLPTGIKALWFRLTGQYRAIRRQNEAEAYEAQTRDRNEQQALIDSQQAGRQLLQHEVRSMRFRHVLGIRKLNRDMAEFLKPGTSQQDEALKQKQQRRELRPRQRRRPCRDRGPAMH